jgi:glycerophosphoryl diester phosphodiesterase
MNILAHRGASQDAPENTLAALRLAWERQADGVEFDVRFSSDGEVVLIHDESTLRTTGVDRIVEQTPLTALQELDAGAWKKTTCKGTRIPTLVEAWGVIPEDKFVIIDVKSSEAIVPLLIAEIKRSSRPPNRTLFVGPNLDVLKSLKKTLPDHDVLWNRSRRCNDSHPSWSATIDRWMAEAGQAGLNGLGLDNAVKIDQEVKNSMAEAGLSIFAWTVNDPAEKKRLCELGVEFLATDCP